MVPSVSSFFYGHQILLSSVAFSLPPFCRFIKLSPSLSSQHDIEVQQHCNHTFSQQEIVFLYERFCQLDRSGGGFIFANEFLSVPEFALNPLSQASLPQIKVKAFVI